MAPVRMAFFVLGLLALFASFAAGQSGGGGGGRGQGRGRGKRGAPAWGTRGGGGKKGGKRGPPPESIAACEASAKDADCKFRSPRGHDVTGQCKPLGGRQRQSDKLHCRPERRRGGQGKGPGGGPRGGNQRGNRPPPPAQMQRNSSLEACAGLAVEEACTFRPPVMADQEARGFDRGGNMRGGQRGRGGWNTRKKDFKQRRAPPKYARPSRPGVCVPITNTDGTNANFCRPLPPEEATPACEALNEGDKCNFATNGSDVFVNLKVTTGKQPMAETTGDVLASFFVNGEWTDPELFFSGSEQGQEMGKTFLLTAWPSKVTLTIWSNDAWCFWKMSVNDTVILKDPAGATGSDSYAKDDGFQSFSDSRFWIEGPPSSQMFDVPAAVTADQVGQQSIKLKLYTATSQYAGTKGSVFVSFMTMEPKPMWTDPELVFAGANVGEEKENTFQVNSWPNKVWIGTNSSDAYGYWKITINDLDVIQDPAGSAGSQEYDQMGSLDEPDKFWIESPPASQTFGIPRKIGPRWAKKHRVRGTCQEAWWDMMNGTLHCRPSNKEWKPHGLKNNEGNRRAPNRMEPNWNIKSDAPEEENTPVKVMMVVKNVNYDELMQDSSMRADFERRTKRVIAAEAGQGVYMEHVTLALSKGSVVVEASINPPAYISRSYLQKQLAQPTLSTNLAKTLETMPGISGVSVGPPLVAAPSPPQRRRRGKKDDDDDKVVVFAIIAAGATCVAICACLAVCVMMKKLKKKNADPEINGTTVAIGRPVQPGQAAVGNEPINPVTEGIPVNPIASGAEEKAKAAA